MDPISLIGAFILGVTAWQGYDFVSEKYHKKKFDRKVIDKQNEYSKQFLKDKFNITNTKIFKVDTTIDTAQELDSTILIPLQGKNISYNDCPLDVIEIILAYIKNRIINELSKQDIIKPAVQCIAVLGAEEYFDRFIVGEGVISNSQSIDTIKQENENSCSVENFKKFRKSYGKYHSMIKKKEPAEEINNQIKKEIWPSHDDIKTVKEILEEKEIDTPIITESVEDDRIIFPDTSYVKIDRMKKARLKGIREFKEELQKSDIQYRSEQIFAYIIEKSGQYITEIAEESGIPMSTISRYITSMVESKIAIKNPTSQRGTYRKYVYPYFSEQEIIDNHNSLVGNEIAINGILCENEGRYFIKDYEKISLENIKKKYLNKEIVIIGDLNVSKKKISITINNIEII